MAGFHLIIYGRFWVITEVVDSFSYCRAAQFDQRPELLSTRDSLNAFIESPNFDLKCKKIWSLDERASPFLLLMTDALAHWTFRLAEEGNPPWEQLSGISESSALQTIVAEERKAKRMRTDDVTLIVISLSEGQFDGVPVT
jgi:hypothetical protein